MRAPRDHAVREEALEHVDQREDDRAMTTLSEAMSGALSGYGGYLRCEECGRKRMLGDPAHRVLTAGWPKCCGYTMRWWTQRQIDAGEAPEVRWITDGDGDVHGLDVL